jgi:hypothetical protein
MILWCRDQDSPAPEGSCGLGSLGARAVTMHRRHWHTGLCRGTRRFHLDIRYHSPNWHAVLKTIGLSSVTVIINCISFKTSIKPHKPTAFSKNSIKSTAVGFALALLLQNVKMSKCQNERALTLAHPASYPMGTRGSFPGGKAVGVWSWPLTSVQCRGKECVELYLHSSNTPSWRGAQLKHRDNFTFLRMHLVLALVWYTSRTRNGVRHFKITCSVHYHLSICRPPTCTVRSGNHNWFPDYDNIKTMMVKIKVTVKLSQDLTRYHAMKTYGGADV